MRITHEIQRELFGQFVSSKNAWKHAESFNFILLFSAPPYWDRSDEFINDKLSQCELHTLTAWFTA